ncbi:large ribosomal subunit protein bL32m [Mustela nigripes]|uniref:Large ribosomal subunit protein bL32m n=2 Tax=Mustela putorius furo TaxID=9669 RepID=M3Z373_MUSPF|nr:39S ribosomal protein L32, mitochondrial [Mustela putorius furo]XP_032160667.1 39S ribosomal protein L32, mitochondrial [Mustela erminea]XP_059253200.1 large ribosomal subunit protein bL32m [Mustela nigripes]
MASTMLVLVFPRWPAARGLLRSCWDLLQRKLQQTGPGLPSPPWGPALAIQGPAVFTEPANDTNGSKEIPSLSDSIFWMAAPKNRRSIEVNRCRRRNPQKLIKVKNNIDVCPECGHLKLKHVLCGYCYEKVCKETAEIRRQMGKQEGGPFKAPSVETVVLYAGEVPSEQDLGKRIIERDRKRPSWFTQN